MKRIHSTPVQERASGILLHITSLPSAYGIGDFGSAARQFIDFLVAGGQRYWQFLPLAPVDQIFGYSPYMSLAAFAGNPLLISPDSLVCDGLLLQAEVDACPSFSPYQVEFSAVTAFKQSLLGKAFERLPRSLLLEDFHEFCQTEAAWLDDYALFMSIRAHVDRKAWYEWDTPLLRRDKQALVRVRALQAETISYYQFEQFIFFRQWRDLRQYAADRGVLLLGDLPIYVSLDSADVWANQGCFLLDEKTSTPTHVAGVPPDYFSKTGQRWGNPLYRWKSGLAKNEALYAWWRQRFRQIGQMVDSVRIDHFRAFESFWQIPVKEETAIRGKWVKGPGKQFFAEMAEQMANLSVIAEDLGEITPEVIALREALGFPGMKILHFAFDSDAKNLYLPHNFVSSRCVVFTGTHDNNTTVGWFLEDASDEVRQRVLRYAHGESTEIHWQLIRLALSSVAETAIIPMQDLLGFGGDCRMNLPGSAKGNWQWRCAARFMSPETAERLRDETAFYGRS
ncbi:MAG: 4-alpha-glucanotransferase [Desulfobulbaceae bacterium]|nr:4-alpha-glucanotransferase [Desulfobulbaceae bacterium]